MLDSMTEIDRKILATAILGGDVTEGYSPERVAKVAAKFGLRAGSSFDLTNGWDFNIAEHRRKAWSKVKDESPYLLIGFFALHVFHYAARAECGSAWPQARVDGQLR